MKIKRIEKMNYIIDHEFEPVRAHSLDAGLDLRTPVDVTIPAHGSAIADLGIHFEIPEGWFGKLESKSGLNVMKQVFCGGGVIDSGFTGSIKARLIILVMKTTHSKQVTNSFRLFFFLSLLQSLLR